MAGTEMVRRAETIQTVTKATSDPTIATGVSNCSGSNSMVTPAVATTISSRIAVLVMTSSMVIRPSTCWGAMAGCRLKVSCGCPGA